MGAFFPLVVGPRRADAERKASVLDPSPARAGRLRLVSEPSEQVFAPPQERAVTTARRALGGTLALARGEA